MVPLCRAELLSSFLGGRRRRRGEEEQGEKERWHRCILSGAARWSLEEKLRGVTPGGKRWTTTRNSLLHSDEDKPWQPPSCLLCRMVRWYLVPSPSSLLSLPPSHLSARLVNVRPFVSTPSSLLHVPPHCFYFAAGLADDTMKYVKECVHEVKTFRRRKILERERKISTARGTCFWRQWDGMLILILLRS